MPFELIQVTAAYSNAVLVAIMPHVSHFAKTLDLPIPQPVTVAQVRHFGCSPRADHVGGLVVLTNEYAFTFDQGQVVLYRSPQSYYSQQDPARIPEFYGPVKIREDDAVKVAKTALKKLGYSEVELYLNQTPKVTPPPKSQSKQVARFLVEWFSPNEPTPKGGIPRERIAVEVDASTKKILMLGIQNKSARRPDPKLDVHAPVIAEKPKSELVGGRKMSSISETYSNAFVTAVLPEVSDYIKKAGFDVKLPLTSGDIDSKNSTLGLVEGTPIFFCYLKSGDRFVYSHGLVIEFDMHDSYRIPEPNKPFEDKPPDKFYGPVKVQAGDALAVATKALNQLGFTAQTPRLKRAPQVVPPRKDGTNYFARYFFNWWPDDEGMQIAVAEVDATTKKLKALYINDRFATNIWRDPPVATSPDNQ